MVVEEGRRVAKDELGLPNVEVEGMTHAGRAYTIGRFHSMKCAQNAAGTRDWEWKLCTKVIAHTVGEKGVALQLDTDTMSRLLSIREGTDDSFMSLEELLDLAPKSNGGTDCSGKAGARGTSERGRQTPGRTKQLGACHHVTAQTRRNIVVFRGGIKPLTQYIRDAWSPYN